MKVTDVVATSNRTATEIDLFNDINVKSSELRSKIKDQVGQYLLEAIQQAVGHEESPVEGEGKFPKLSKEYAAKKQQEVGDKLPNLEVTGGMLDALSYRDTSEGLEIGIYGDEAPKADGHNNLSGDSKLPRRRFLPDVGQNFTSDIQDQVRQIIANAIADDNPFEASDFEDVETKADLYDVLSDVFDGLTRAEIKSAVVTNQDLFDMLKDEDLIDLL